MLVINKVFLRKDWLGWTRPKLLALALSLPATSAVTYFAMDRVLPDGVNWSVRKALRWCANPSWVDVDTSPLYNIARFSGAALGLALAAKGGSSGRTAWSRNGPNTKWDSRLVVRLAIGLALSYSFNLAHKRTKEVLLPPMKDVAAAASTLTAQAPFLASNFALFAALVWLAFFILDRVPRTPSVN